VSPNWSFQLPGGDYDGPDPEGFTNRDEIVSRFDKYVEKNQIPIAYNTCVTAVKRTEDGYFLIQSEGKSYHTNNVIAANGWFQVGKFPLSLVMR
jgi:putative flavoprotein involved in K+ transport